MREINTGDLREGGTGFSQRILRTGLSSAETKYEKLVEKGRVGQEVPLKQQFLAQDVQVELPITGVK